MMNNVANEGRFVLGRALACLDSGVADPLVGPTTADWSERCVEVPWVAAQLTSAQRVLDIGWAMSPPEWLGVLLALVDRGVALTGMDIIDPQRVRSRYPVEIAARVLDIPVRVENVLEAEAVDGLFDVMTCVSTLEHIGFDVASPAEETTTAFVRGNTPGEAVSDRDPATDRRFLDAASRLLEPGGLLLLSVPAGQGVPILHQDSLGLFTHQFEYDESAWKAITSDRRFTLEAEAFFRHDQTEGWHQVSTFAHLSDQTSAMRPFATGCAVASLRLSQA